MIIIEKGLLKSSGWVEHVRPLARRFVMITDSTVERLWARGLCEQLKGLDMTLLSFPQGEGSKMRRVKESLEDEMLERGLGRDTAIIAVGGGVVSDLAGFVAATYCRGIPWVVIATTLLGMVDASIGGKVAVNTPHAKNTIGAFHPPRFIFNDLDVLETLAAHEIQNGMSEIIKYALIASKELFEKLEGADPKVLIEESCRIKQEIVAQDPQEKGLRTILNFGHTVGHAIETASGYAIAHGQAVAMGMVVEATLSYRLGYLQKEDVIAIYKILKHNGLRISIPQTIYIEQLMNIMLIDKKALSSQSRFVLLESIGKAKAFDGAYCTPVDPQIVRETLQEVQGHESI